eukprot:TRINITY_DN6657_c0_g3_i3.p3 TRINITY_DN6657_c0_g3~~TRINITY_DN6657_c0_g3_i3.p3  ORF type:complete len:121 (+),score=13.19 TRINITY_DN6657_c0_g3_i3:72-434(+)
MYSQTTGYFFVFFFNDTATTEIYTLHIVGSVRCVQETVPTLFSFRWFFVSCIFFFLFRFLSYPFTFSFFHPSTSSFLVLLFSSLSLSSISISFSHSSVDYSGRSVIVVGGVGERYGNRGK